MHLDNLLDPDRFSLARRLSDTSIFNQNSIGCLSEKTLHKTLKYFIEPNEDFHEVEYLGSVADIKNSHGIIEIQTRSFDKLKAKLDRFLTETNVTVVYPIVQNKNILRVDFESGEVISRRRSNKHGRLSDALLEIAKLRDVFLHKNLSILVLILNADETRFSQAKQSVGKKSTEKIDIIPTSVNGYFEVREDRDLYSLLPANLPLNFTSKDFAKHTGYRKIKLHIVLKFLMERNVISRKKGKGNSFIYNVNK